MFIKKYLDDFNFELLCDNYEEYYLESLSEEHFKLVYDLFFKYHFYCINDIIVNYLELFELELFKLEKNILKLKQLLGDKFIYIIGNDLRYLNYLFED